MTKKLSTSAAALDVKDLKAWLRVFIVAEEQAAAAAKDLLTKLNAQPVASGAQARRTGRCRSTKYYRNGALTAEGEEAARSVGAKHLLTKLNAQPVASGTNVVRFAPRGGAA